MILTDENAVTAISSVFIFANFTTMLKDVIITFLLYFFLLTHNITGSLKNKIHENLQKK